jgi:hypothetical protein
MNKTQNILAKISPLTKNKPDVVKQAAELALKRLYPHIKISEEKIEAITDRLRKSGAATNKRINRGVLHKIREMLFGPKAARRGPLPEREFFSGSSYMPGAGENKRTNLQGLGKEMFERVKAKAEKIPGAWDKHVGDPMANIANELMGDAPARWRQQTGEGFADVFDPMGKAVVQGVKGRYNAAKEAIRKEYNDYRDILKKPQPPRTAPHSPESGLERGIGSYTPEAGDSSIGGMSDYYDNLYKSTAPFRKAKKNDISPGEGI